MSSIAVQGGATGTGLVTVVAPSTSTNRTLTLPDSTGTLLNNASSIARAQLPAGTVLQVVQAFKSDTFTTTSASFTTITGLTASITPSSASNKVLVIMTVTGSQQVNVNDSYVGLFRDSTQIGLGDASGTRIRSSSQLMTSNAGWSTAVTINFVDSPATMSAITYSAQARVNSSGTLYINRGNSDADGALGAGRTMSSLILMEVAA